MVGFVFPIYNVLKQIIWMLLSSVAQQTFARKRAFRLFKRFPVEHRKLQLQSIKNRVALHHHHTEFLTGSEIITTAFFLKCSVTSFALKNAFAKLFFNELFFFALVWECKLSVSWEPSKARLSIDSQANFPTRELTRLIVSSSWHKIKAFEFLPDGFLFRSFCDCNLVFSSLFFVFKLGYFFFKFPCFFLVIDLFSF